MGAREKEVPALDWKLWDRIDEVHPLIHQITNAVTVNDCANITLACGASPVMADAPEEAAEMAAASDAVVINIGTLGKDQLEVMALAGESANKCGVPVALDPWVPGPPACAWMPSTVC